MGFYIGQPLSFILYLQMIIAALSTLLITATNSKDASTAAMIALATRIVGILAAYLLYQPALTPVISTQTLV
ncbi:MAG: hypothetical protein ACRBCI_09380 [Cellvibrionaceae bacterium]